MTDPTCPADRRPGDVPFFIPQDCPACGLDAGIFFDEPRLTYR